jgi:hypothetical protein
VLREERRLTVFQNWMLRKIFGLKGKEVTGHSRKLHSEESRDFYASANLRVTKQQGEICATYGTY